MTSPKTRFTRDELQLIRDRVPVSDVAGTRVKLRKNGAEFSGLCPFHTEKTPSFTVNDGKQFFHCFGCGEHGDVITLYMKFRGVAFARAVEDLAAGKVTLNQRDRREADARRAVRPKWQDQPAPTRTAQAGLARWSESQSLAAFDPQPGLMGAVSAHRYLRETRGIPGPLPPALRGHFGIRHPHLDRDFPALIAGIKPSRVPVRGPSGLIAVHIIYLEESPVPSGHLGSIDKIKRPLPAGHAQAGKRAAPKMTFGSYGGGWVSLDRHPCMPALLVVTEGIEDGLALKCLFDPVRVAVRAAIGSSNIPNLAPPSGVGFFIAADANTAGRTALDKARARGGAAGADVTGAPPPADPDNPDRDWNEWFQTDPAGLHAWAADLWPELVRPWGELEAAIEANTKERAAA